jgi:hypothetical protein
MADTLKYLSKIIAADGSVYNLKDATAQSELADLIASLGTAAKKSADDSITSDATGVASTVAIKNYVDSAVGRINQFEYEVVESLPVASADTMYKIYLVAITNASSPDAYAEYITLRSGSEGAYTYAFEKIGDTNLGLSGYVPTSRTVAGLALSADISADAFKTALGLGKLAYVDSVEGTVESKTVSNVKATGTSTGEIAVKLTETSTNITSTGSLTSNAVDISIEKYTPAGGVTVSSKIAAEGDTANYTPAGTVSLPKVKVSAEQATSTVKVLDNEGTGYSFSKEGSVSHAEDTTSNFATTGLVASIDEANETLTFSTASTSKAVTTVGKIEYTAPTLSGSLPTFKEATVMTGLNNVSAKYVAGENETDTTEATFSGVASVITAGFRGTEATLTGSGSVKDTTVSVSGSVKEYAVDTENTKFTGKSITLDVGDITVPSQTVTSTVPTSSQNA